MFRKLVSALLAALVLLPFARTQDSGVGFITKCKPGYFGLTFDDGPSIHTGRLLDTLAAAQVKVTFFILGNKLTAETSAFTKRAYDEGHQIGSHTWDHKSLNSLSVDKIKKEMLMNDEAIKKVTGVIPNYMRPPYGDCNAKCASTLASLGYHVVQWNIDSNDWRYEKTPSKWPMVTEDTLTVEDDKTAVTKNPRLGYISLQHDTLPFSVDQVPQIIERIKALDLQIATIEQCIDNPPAPMYRGGQFSNQTMIPADQPSSIQTMIPADQPSSIQTMTTINPAGQQTAATSAEAAVSETSGLEPDPSTVKPTATATEPAPAPEPAAVAPLSSSLGQDAASPAVHCLPLSASAFLTIAMVAAVVEVLMA